MLSRYSILDMKPYIDIVTSFSKTVTEFAFQTNVLQKNAIDIYSLDSLNDYNINSSLISRVDYEGNDLKASEVFFIGWCTNSELNSKDKTKRARNGENRITNYENFFVSAFHDGKIVVFSSTGKQIVNIIQNKKGLLHIDTDNEFIWILDCEFTVKAISYAQTKPLKSFQLLDMKDLKINSFKVFPGRKKKIYLVLSTEEALFLIDPSHNKPRTILKIEQIGCSHCQILNDENQEKLVVTTNDKVLLFDISNGELIEEWKLKVDRVRVYRDLILMLDAEDNITVLKTGNDRSLSRIEMPDAHVIDFIMLKDTLFIAWLNVNEPNFKLLPLEELRNHEKIVLNGLQGENVKDQEQNGETNRQPEDASHLPKYRKRQVSTTEQDEINQSLMYLLDKKDSEEILSILSSPNWTEQRIKSFVIYHMNNYENTKLIFEVISSNFHREIWNRESSLAKWLKWLLTLRSVPFDDKHVKKDTKRLRASLKNSADSLPILIGIQGRLELLRKQAELRKSLTKLDASEADDKGETMDHASITIDGDGDVENESIQFVNGESDTYIDM